jgi:hypothetical protein
VKQLAVLPSHPEVIVVAGTFTGADTVTCHGICLFDTTRKQWSALGAGVDAEIASITFAGPNSDLLIAAGSIMFPDKTAVNVAQYSVANSTWMPVGNSGQLPGPATAVEVNELNQNSIFAAGRCVASSITFYLFPNDLVIGHLMGKPLTCRTGMARRGRLSSLVFRAVAVSTNSKWFP